MADISLSGTWQGVYSYSCFEHVPFTATLADEAGALSGSTSEPDWLAVGTASELAATLTGTRAGRSVSFTKVYGVRHERCRPVLYAGTLISDDEEIEGTWQIPGMAEVGTFLMIRPSRARQDVAQRVEERA